MVGPQPSVTTATVSLVLLCLLILLADDIPGRIKAIFGDLSCLVAARMKLVSWRVSHENDSESNSSIPINASFPLYDDLVISNHLSTKSPSSSALFIVTDIESGIGWYRP
jgi:hypothetical protein